MSQIDPDPTMAARKIACVLLGLVEPDTAKVLAAASVDRGEPWLYEHWRKWLSASDLIAAHPDLADLDDWLDDYWGDARD